MGYRIHFTHLDLARTRVAEGPMPMHELELAARALQGRGQPMRFETWRRRARTQLSAQARMVLALMPAVGYSPGFLSPAKMGSFEDLLEHVRSTPAERVRRDLLEATDSQCPFPAWAYRLAEDETLFEDLCTGLGHLYGCLLAPYWAEFTEHLAADRSLRLQHFLAGGVEQLLTQANPQWMRWNPPVLEVRTVNGIDRDLHLGGRGMLLVPSMIHRRAIVTDGHPPAISYPAHGGERVLKSGDLPFLSPQAADVDGMAMLLGRTRTLVLTTIVEHPGCTTKDLASRARIAPASASEHATVLRNAGLISSSRHRNFVFHSPTPLGLALLKASGG